MNALGPYVGWWFLPTAVGYVQSFWYNFSIRAGEPKPQPGSPAWIRDNRRIYVGLIVGYLAYTVYEADWQLQRAGDFYRDLGVPLDVTDKALASRFRRLTVLHHPDKVNSDDALGASAYYVHLRTAKDVLIDPAKRFAYDRFGPDVLNFPKSAITVSDYLTHGLLGIARYYAASGLMLVFLGMLGYLQWGTYWRYLAFASIAAFEGHALTRPYYPVITTMVINPVFQMFGHPLYLPFQTITVARKILISFFIALNQLAPLLRGRPGDRGANTEAAQNQQLDRLNQVVRGTDIEVTRLLGFETAPFAGDEQGAKELQEKLKEWLVQNTIRSDPEVRNAVGQTLRRRRQGAPTGAAGTT